MGGGGGGGGGIFLRTCLECHWRRSHKMYIRAWHVTQSVCLQIATIFVYGLFYPVTRHCCQLFLHIPSDPLFKHVATDVWVQSPCGKSSLICSGVLEARMFPKMNNVISKLINLHSDIIVVFLLKICQVLGHNRETHKKATE